MALGDLSSIPFYGAYTERRRQNEQRPLAELQQVAGVQGILANMQKQQELKQAQAMEQARREALASTGGDVEKAMQVLISRGDTAGAAKLAPILEARRKAQQGQPIGAGGLLRPDGTVVPPIHRPTAPPAQPEIVKLQQYLQTLPAGDPNRAAIEQRIKLLQERQPQVQINMPGSSDTMLGPDGRYYKFQVGKDGQVRAVPMVTPTGEPLRPPPTGGAAAKKDDITTEDLVEIERLGGELNSLVQQNQGLFRGVVGPQGYVGRIWDLAAGAAGADTPAIDFANKSKLFLSSVRKMVEKDSNLSNQERQNLLEAIGVGFWQTGPSSIRARNDVMSYVRNKRMSGLKPSSGAATSHTITIRGDAEYNALPSGTEFIGPDGVRRKKP